MEAAGAVSALEHHRLAASDVPRTFHSIVARDLWLWKHMGSGLLRELDLERLTQLPDHEAVRPAGQRWAEYAKHVAVNLEKQNRWSEAQAYWLATAQVLAEATNTDTEPARNAIAGLVRTGAHSSGMAPNTRADLDDLIEAGIRTPNQAVRESIVKSVVLAGTIYPDTYDELNLSANARAEFGSVLMRFSPALARGSQKLKGTHLWFAFVVAAFTDELARARGMVDGLVGQLTLGNLISKREKLLESFAKMASLSLPFDKLCLARTQSLMGAELSRYVGLGDDATQVEVSRAIGSAEALGQETAVLGSHLAACVIGPLSIAVRYSIEEHFEGSIRSRFPILEVGLLKPARRHADGTLSVEIEVGNEGNAPAEEAGITLANLPGTGVRVTKQALLVARIAPKERRLFSCSVQAETDTESFEIECQLEWRDRGGEHRRIENLKIGRQREVEWDSIGLAPTPYRIQSIKDPAELKGRGELLRQLRFGFLAEASFLVTGQKRVGKTSLVRVFLTELETTPRVLRVYVPIGEVQAMGSGADLGKLGQDLCDRLLEEYEDQFGHSPEITVPPLRQFNEGFNATFTRFIRLFSKRYSVRLAFALDDLDELPADLFMGPAGKAFFMALRALMNAGNSFFFIGSERLPGIMEQQAERINQVRPLKVDYLSRGALAELVREPAQWLEYADEAISEIEEWSAGNPYFATLICNAIWQRALRTRDSWVVKRDVLAAVEELAQETERNSYQHFWSDSPLARDEDRDLYETKSSIVILTLTRHQPGPLAFADRRHVVGDCDGLASNEAERHLQDLINRYVIETNADNANLIRIRVPLFTLWLKRRGASELYQSEARKARLASESRDLSSDEVSEMAAGLSYQGREITLDEVRLWLMQFGAPANQRLMLKLLKRISNKGLFTPAKYSFGLAELHKLARISAGERNYSQIFEHSQRVQNWFITHTDATGKSGSQMVKQYRNVNRIYEKHCGDPRKVFASITQALESDSLRQVVVVAVDDYVGTGRSASDDLSKEFLPAVREIMIRWPDRLLLIYAALVGQEEGLDKIRQTMGGLGAIVCYMPLSEADRAFSPENDVFDSDEERIRARDVAHNVGSILEKNQPLGWEDSQGLTIFPESVPNNTLPILWKVGAKYKGKPWKALFPRG